MIFAKNFARNYEKEIILGTSDAWSMSRSSQRPTNPAYYIEDCRILGQSLLSKDRNHCTGSFLIPLIRIHCTIYGPHGCKFDPHICQMMLNTGCLKLKCN